MSVANTHIFINNAKSRLWLPYAQLYQNEISKLRIDTQKTTYTYAMPQYLSPVSISDKTSYLKILWSLEVARFVFKIVRSLWNLTGTMAEHCCRGGCQILKQCDNLNCQSRGLETSRDLTIRRLIGYWNGARVRDHVWLSMAYTSLRVTLRSNHAQWVYCWSEKKK